MFRHTRLIATVITSVAALTLAACGNGTDSAGEGEETTDSSPLAKTVKLTYLYSPSLTNAPAYVALAKGYFKDEKLDVTMKPFTGDSAQVVPLLATGKADVIGTSSSPGFFNGIVNNVGVKFVAAAGVPRPGAPTAAYVVRNDGPIKKVADLKGKKVALVGGAASVSGYLLSEVLKQGGLKFSDVEVVNLDFDSALGALDTGAVAAAVQSQPNIQREVSSGDYSLLGDWDEIYANGSGSGVIFGPTLLKENRQAGTAFLRAIQKAAADHLQGDYLKDPDIAKIIADATASTVEVTQTLPAPTFAADLAINPKVYESIQEFFLSIGALTYKDPLRSDAIIDQALVDAAKKSSS